MLLPHRNLLGDVQTIKATGWRHDGTEIDESVPWQPGLDLTIQSEMSIDLNCATGALGFNPIGSTEIVVEWMSNSTRLREHCARFDADEQMELTVTLPGDRIGGTLKVHRRLVTKGAIDSDDPFAPAGPGALLWEDIFTIRVEGTGSQFAVVTTSFKAAGLSGDAAWALRMPRLEEIVDHDILDEPAAEHVGVSFNGDHPLAIRITAGGADDDVAHLALSTIMCELANGIIALAPALDTGTQFHEPGTLGALIITTMKKIGVVDAAELSKFDHQQLSALIQGHFLNWSDG